MTASSSIDARLGVVSYLNTLPLIDGLERARGVQIVAAVPSSLSGLLAAGATDLSLCSVIDQQRSKVPLELVPVGQIGCDGPTWTVRLFSKRSLSETEIVGCDVDSHTSVALLRILLREQYGLQPRFEPFDASRSDRRDWPDTVLLIGDKVVRSGPGTDTHPYQLDLGEAWRELTGLPFVFASWFRRADATGDDLERARRLAVLVDHARRRNRHRIASIAKRHAPSHGWEIAQAIEYLGTRLCYECTPRSIEAIRTFLEAASTVRESGEPGEPGESCPPLRIASDVMAST
jgi:chorismate dehydratase